MGVRAPEQTGPTCDPGPKPESPSDVRQHVDQMHDLLVLALQCDQTRIATFMLGNGGRGRVYDFLGILGGHHYLSRRRRRGG